MKQMVMSRALYSAYLLLVIENRESKQINTCKKYGTNDQLPQQKLLKSEIAPTGLVNKGFGHIFGDRAELSITVGF